MAKLRRFNNNFTTGEVAPSTYELYNLSKRENGLATLKNCTIIPAGGLVRRDGTRFVVNTKNAGETVRLIPFTFSRSQAYVLEMGNLYIRFYRDNGQLQFMGSPVEVTTPYTIAEVPDVDYAQDSDTLVLTHPDHAPMVLQRNSDTDWTLKNLQFSTEPTEIRTSTDLIAITMTQNLGMEYNVASILADTFTPGDIGRTLRATNSGGVGEGFITEFINGMNVTILWQVPFGSLNLAAGQWEMTGAPIANLAIHDLTTGKETTGGLGNYVSINAYKTPAPGAEEVTNFDFATGDTTGWTVTTGRVIGTGGPSANDVNNILTDSVNWKLEGVEPNHVVELTQSGNVLATAVVRLESPIGFNNPWSTIIIQQQGTNPSQTNGDTFTIKDSSFTKFSSGEQGPELHAGANGVALISQNVTGVQDLATHEWKVVLEHDSATFFVGTEEGLDDLVPRTRLLVGETSGTFLTAPVPGSTTDIWIHVENNQFNTWSRVNSVSIKNARVGNLLNYYSVGDFIRVNDGYIKITNKPSLQLLEGVVTKALDDAQDGLPGSWTIDKSQWSAGSYPSHVAFYQGRLIFTGGLKVWGSNLLDIRDFAFGASSTDAIQFTPAATQVNPPHWVTGDSQLVLGTRSEEYVVSGTQTNAITPSDINVNSPAAIGSDPVRPVRISQAMVFVKGGGRRLIEFNLSAQEDRISRDLSVLASHLIPRGDRIKTLAWQEEPFQQLWCVTTLGKLFALTYVREQDVWGWSRHDSEDGATYSSVAVIPNPDGDRDQVWFAVRRPGTAQDLMEFQDDEGGLIPSYPNLTTDGTVRYNGASTTIISGLAHLINSGDVWVVDAMGSQGPLTVTGGGQVTFQRPVTTADVGVHYKPLVTTLRPSVDGRGPTGLLIGNTNLFVSFADTGDGINANGKLLKMRRPTDPMDGRITPFSGELEIPSLGTNRQAVVTITQDAPEAFNLLSVAGTLVIEDI